MSSFFSSSPAFSSWASPMDMCPRVQPEWFTYIVDHASASLSAISPGRRSSSPAWSSELCSRAVFFFDALDSMRFHLWRLLTAANPSLCFRHGLGGHRHHCVVLACRVSVCILSCSNNFTQVRKSRL